jgi:2,4-diketo-3-deoxy-L-fuconate hydrolase
MRLCRYDDNKLGLVEDDSIVDVSTVLARLSPARWPLPQGDLLFRELGMVLDAARTAAPNGKRIKLADARLMSPVANPSKVSAAPVNYLKHLEEAKNDPSTFHKHHLNKIQEVGLFLKSSSSVVGPSEGVRLRFPHRRNDHEIELAVIIGREADNVPAAKAFDYIAGYSIGLDMTVRGPEERSMRKSIDSYTVIGPYLVTPDEISDPSQLDLELLVNGEVRQKANTRDLVIGIADLIAWASSFYKLFPGDIILTGTPDGVGPVQPGDTITARIAEIGEMSVPILAA